MVSATSILVMLPAQFSALDVSNIINSYFEKVNFSKSQ